MTPAPFTVFVAGEPAPQGSKNTGRRGQMYEASKKLGPWRSAVAWQARQKRGDEVGFLGPVHVELVFMLRRPPSIPKRRTVPSVKPDIDKLQRSTFDGLADAGVIRNDALVVEVRAAKVYAEPGHGTGAFITVTAA